MTTTEPRHIDTAEVARYVRKHLKATFPATKFSVRIERYSMGSSIDIRWTDGPTCNQVREAVGPFRGGRFQGMTDCAYSADSWYCPEHGARTAETYGSDLREDNDVRQSRCCHRAELVHFGNTSMEESRSFSPDFQAELERAVAKDLALEVYDPNYYTGFEWAAHLLYRKGSAISR